jgi:predicted protein tyrosine phosphatase
MIKEIVFMSQNKAERLNPSSSSAIISITDPGKKANLRGWSNILTLQFDDLCPEELILINRKDLLNNSKLFDGGHARQIYLFVKGLPDHVNTLFIHCKAGVSRSTALAYFIADKLGASVLNESGERSNPNPHVVKVMMENW